MDAKIIAKYQKYSIPQLIKKATDKFNAYIRKRDFNETCISCNENRVLQAGHFYSGGHYPELKFNEDNVHGQCLHCNYYESGNLIKYRINLEKKIGKERLEKLDYIVSQKRKTGYKWDRFFLIEIIEKYKKKSTDWSIIEQRKEMIKITLL